MFRGRTKFTFEKIADEWKENRANRDNDVLDKRTFYRYRRNIELQFGINLHAIA